LVSKRSTVAIGRIGQHNARRHAISLGLFDLSQGDIKLGLELNVLRYARSCAAGGGGSPFLWQIQAPLDRQAPPYKEAHDDYLANYVATGQAKVIGIGRVVTGLRKNGEPFPMHLGVTEAATPEGKFFIGLVRDMTIEERMRRQIEYLATHDSLTGLPNRNECWKRLEERYALRDGRHGPADCSVFYCDLDGFKQINDQYGHAAGDAVLKETALRFKEVLFVRDFIARIGGDEFVAIIDGLQDNEKATALAQRMIEAVSRPCRGPSSPRKANTRSVSASALPTRASTRNPSSR
jgi:diguanylate cyclase (GGDEF)-like protein